MLFRATYNFICARKDPNIDHPESPVFAVFEADSHEEMIDTALSLKPTVQTEDGGGYMLFIIDEVERVFDWERTTTTTRTYPDGRTEEISEKARGTHCREIRQAMPC